MFGREKYKLLWRFYTRPVLPFTVEFIVLTPLILTPDTGDGSVLYLFLAPWLVLFFAVMNLPLIARAFSAFRMDVSKKRNHALEHATILHLEKATGRRCTGRAESDGFRIAGRVEPGEILMAFGRVRRAVRERQPLVYVSRRCGSNAVTALALGLSLRSAWRW